MILQSGIVRVKSQLFINSYMHEETNTWYMSCEIQQRQLNKTRTNCSSTAVIVKILYYIIPTDKLGLK